MFDEYPDVNEVFAFFENFIGLDNSIDFFKSRGMFFVSLSKSEVAKYGSKIIFGYEDFTEIKSITATKQNYNKISGFSIITRKEIDEVRQVFRVGEVLKEKNSLSIKSVTSDRNNNKIKISYSFERKVPGKMSLISTEERVGTFWVEPTGDEGIQIAIFNHKKNEDYVEIKDIIRKSFARTDEYCDIVPFNLTRYSLENRIELIDAILNHDYDDWTLEEVISIRVKAGEEISEELEDSSELESTQEVTEELEDESEEINGENDVRDLLKGINDAILQGHDLRHNSFVVKCESAGYYFPSVTMRMSHTREAYKIDLEVQFKFRPEMPEITIKNSFIVEDGEVNPYTLNEEFRKSTLDYFFHKIVAMYRSF